MSTRLIDGDVIAKEIDGGILYRLLIIDEYNNTLFRVITVEYQSQLNEYVVWKAEFLSYVADLLEDHIKVTDEAVKRQIKLMCL